MSAVCQDAAWFLLACAGILPSNDKMLQSRLFSYQDTQRHRLGPNYQQLPINRPRCPFQVSHALVFLHTGSHAV